jgi:hypothetical protein
LEQQLAAAQQQAIDAINAAKVSLYFLVQQQQQHQQHNIINNDRLRMKKQRWQTKQRHRRRSMPKRLAMS